MRFSVAFACLAALLVPASQAAGEPPPRQPAVVQVALLPTNTQIGLTVYAMGMFPQIGHFARFHGSLKIDPAHFGSCRVDIDVEVQSLDMGVERRTRLALQPDMLDPAHYPSMTYHGACEPPRTTGTLTLHGVTRELSLTEARQDDRIVASGTLHRQDYGISGLPALIGGTILVRFEVDLPASVAALLSKP